MEGIETTFVLAYPDFFKVASIGVLVSYFEDSKFHLKGMMLMDVSKKFIEKHLQYVGEEHDLPEDEFACFNWVDYLTSGPVVAMILEGHKAVNNIKLLASDRENVFFWSFGRPAAYSSGSVDRAKQDIQTWFGQDSKAERSNLVRLHAKGGIDGLDDPFDRIYNYFKNDSYYRMLDKPITCSTDVHACFLEEPMSFLLIKPRAFDENCVGKILSAVEHNSFIVRGLKLVKKSEHPDSIVWSASTKTDGEYGIAMVVTFLTSNFELRDNAPDLKHINLSSQVYLIGSDYVYQSKPDEMTSDVDLFFPHGLTIWTDPESQYLFGRMFEPTLIGLDWED